MWVNKLFLSWCLAKLQIHQYVSSNGAAKKQLVTSLAAIMSWLQSPYSADVFLR